MHILKMQQRLEVNTPPKIAIVGIFVPTLIYQMARAASDGHPDGGWLDELRRVRKEVAPLGRLQLELGALCLVRSIRRTGAVQLALCLDRAQAVSGDAAGSSYTTISKIVIQRATKKL